VPGARARAEQGELAFGTVDTWLLWQLTQGQVHRTDISNASRTLVFDIHQGDWSSELLQAFGIPRSLLPAVLPSVAVFGEVSCADLPKARGLPICGIAGDQQAALVGQLGTKPGRVKNTYGTGCFMLMHCGEQAVSSRHGLLTTRAAGARGFALEGSVFVGGAVVQWLRDGLGFFDSSAEVESLAASVPDSGGVIMVPALTGLGAPYWAPEARGAIYGLSRGTTRAHLARAALESIAYQSTALLQAMSHDLRAAGLAAPTELRVDGGASRNDLLMQFQADVLGLPVLRPRLTETTALGAAWLASLGAGVVNRIEDLEAFWHIERRFEPQRDSTWAQERLQDWELAVHRTVFKGRESA
jgi:glycerol kinase